jgi:hypothetical protein
MCNESDFLVAELPYTRKITVLEIPKVFLSWFCVHLDGLTFSQVSRIFTISDEYLSCGFLPFFTHSSNSARVSLWDLSQAILSLVKVFMLSLTSLVIEVRDTGLLNFFTGGRAGGTVLFGAAISSSLAKSDKHPGFSETLCHRLGMPLQVT